MDIAALREAHPAHWQKACAIRVLTLDAVAAANSGHSGQPMGMADVATVLYEKHLKFDASNPEWPDRDRFILSSGHGSMLIYSLLYLTGSPDMTIDQVKNFRQAGAITAGHPEYGHVRGVETTTGPLGQGISNAVGFAIAEEHLRAVWGKGIYDHYTYVMAGDGCLMEGVSQEAIALAGKQKLGRLIVFWDNNGITIDGKVEIADVTDQKKRFAASGWQVLDCDGHDPDAIDAAIVKAKASRKPSLIACKTHIALGSSAQDTAKGHGALTDPKLIADTKAAYGWTAAPFEIPGDIKSAWEAIGARGKGEREAWEGRLAALSDARRKRFDRALAGDMPEKLGRALKAYRKQLLVDTPKVATRKASEMALNVINPIVQETIGGSADLTGSNLTKTKATTTFSAADYAGRHIYYGIREFGMAAAMNGMALHGGVVPYGGTFLVFADYCRNAIRLSALQHAQAIYVLTHDSIGLGEDGPTHQPVEHVMTLRAIPNLLVFRPADVVETAECWALALEAEGTPSALALSRQNLPQLRTQGGMLSAKGGYRLKAADAARQVVLVATGSEVEVAMATAAALEADGIGADVVSMPCAELFDAQDAAYRADVLPTGVLKVSIEAGVTLGWQKYVGDGLTIGIDTFGKSAPADQLYKYFGLTAEAIVPQIKAKLGL